MRPTDHVPDSALRFLRCPGAHLAKPFLFVLKFQYFVLLEPAPLTSVNTVLFFPPP